ncbi:MAG: hypothetical protein GX444_04440 [Myxococcales bacterium]|nr:hypothetical protein [Myxococcales bacterium]
MSQSPEPIHGVAAPAATSQRARWAIVFCLLLLSFFYALSDRGAVGGELSVRWLAEAVWRDHTLTVNRFDDLGVLDDYAQVGANKYVLWPPGPAFFGLPLYVAGQFAAGNAEPTKADRFGGWPSRAMQLFFCISAALAVVLLFAVCREMGISALLGGAIAALFALGYKTWPYAATYNRHLPTAMLVLAAIYFGLRSRRNPDDARALIGLALGAGLLPLFDYSAGLAIPALLPLGWPALAAAGRRPRRLIGASLAFLVGAVALGAYNWACFGAPWVTSYAHSAQHEWARTFAGTFNGNPFEGLRFLLLNRGTIPEPIVLRTGFPEKFLEFYRRQTFEGLLPYAPYLWLAIPGFLAGLYLPKSRRIFIWLLLALLPTMLLMGAHRTLFGGLGLDTRYFYHVTPILFLAAAFFLNEARARIPARRTFWTALLALGVLLFGIRPLLQNIRQIVSITVKMREICPAVLPGPDLVRAVFPNLPYAGLTFFFLAIFWSCFLLAWEIAAGGSTFRRTGA